MEKETNGNLIVRRIDDILIMKNDNRANMCRALDMKQSTLSTWISSGSLPRVDVALKIAKYLNVSIEWLVYGEEEKLSNEEIELLDEWRTLQDRDKEVIKNMIRSFQSAAGISNQVN